VGALLKMPGGISTRASLGVLAALAVLLPLSVHADEPGETGARGRPRYLPDHAKLQLAGNIGFLSPGVGYAFRGGELEADLFFGWVPEAVGGKSIFSLTGKLTWLPWTEDAHGWSFHPLTLSWQLTNTFGRHFFVLEPEGFPRGYHVLPTALRAGIALGAAAGTARWRLERVRFYYELVALDVMLGFWVRNREALGLTDVFSLALGARAEF
jgi:hypothetical protein